MSNIHFRDRTKEFADLQLLVEISEKLHLVKRNPSQRMLAKWLDISTSKLNECISDINTTYSIDHKCPQVISTNSGVALLPLGEALVLEARKLFALFGEIRDLSQQRVTKLIPHAFVGASPYILTHILTPSVNNFIARYNTATEIRIEEAYNDSVFLESIDSESIDFAVVWNYSGRSERIKRTSGFDCVRSKRKFTAQVAFRPGLNLNILQSPNGRGVLLKELANHSVYVLEEGHRFLAYELPIPTAGTKIKRIKSYSIASSIGSIRAGMQGVAIVPGVFRDLDSYRVDGSMCCLPLYEDTNNFEQKNAIEIEIIYVFKIINDDKKSKNIEEFSADPLALENYELTPSAKQLLEVIEDTLKAEPVTSGWETASDLSRHLPQIISTIEEFVYVYFISTDIIGHSRPWWGYGKAQLKGSKKQQETNKKTKPTPACVFEGSFDYKRPNKKSRLYDVSGYKIGDRILSMHGVLSADSGKNDGDSFAVELNFVFEDGDSGKVSHVVGIWSGRDNSNTQPMSGPFVLSKNKLNAEKLKNDVHVAMIRQMRSVRAAEDLI